ncbi:hypothetical protein QL285_091734 [Trifolium repens]|nr:hypothetical protein QL285_091734 [Trifolium repens]
MLCYFQKGNGLHWEPLFPFYLTTLSFAVVVAAIIKCFSPLIRVLLWQIRESAFVGVDEVSDDFTNFSARKHTVRPLFDRLSKLGFQEPSCAQDSVGSPNL